MLCSLCQTFTTDLLDARGSPLNARWLSIPRDNFVFNHQSNHEALDRSARDGCKLCQVLLKAWPSPDVDFRDVREPRFMHFKIPFASGQTLCRIHAIDADFDKEMKACNAAILASTRLERNENFVLGFTVGWQDGDGFNHAPLDDYRHYQFFTERSWFCPGRIEPITAHNDPPVDLPFLLGRQLHGLAEQLMARSSDDHISGPDSNQRIVNHLLRKQKKKKTVDLTYDPKALMKLMLEVKKARTILSSRKSARIEIPSFDKDEDFSEVLTRAELYELDGLPDARGSMAQTFFSIAKEWLHQCTSTHDACKRAVAPALPTRVLDVGPDDGSAEPYLFISNGATADYVALSHCWGGDIPAKTTSQTFSARCRSTPLALLPKTFQHAVIATRCLGFRYLWIDSMCIIQDSAADWEVESLRMQDVYENAVLTMSALDSTSSRGGMFYPRNQGLIEIGPLQHQVTPDSTLTYYIRPTLPKFKDAMYEGPLNKRAWILQERVLPRAILYFSRTQLYWECRSRYYAEDGDSQPVHPLLKHIDENSEVYFGEQLKSDMYLLWYHLIQEYTGRAITFNKDKLIALAGVASKFEEIYKNQYVAGLWRDDIERGIVWYANTRDSWAARTLDGALVRLEEPKAPSWSWASVNGRVAWDWTNRKRSKRVETEFDFKVLEIGRGGAKDSESMTGEA
ncbi:hypothetical protein H2199_009203 [Coniosporium tulheliwenetii]|uniref:Uncharacterized protein n=1 Tax=Coniosporium tulheliwenetii TaxID=3383036 RepID=A0ACC2YFB6_9PEZI|nr:hypothetical protein H2199_009203 [Cladosporium sp. JES 115]